MSTATEGLPDAFPVLPADFADASTVVGATVVVFVVGGVTAAAAAAAGVCGREVCNALFPSTPALPSSLPFTLTFLALPAAAGFTGEAATGGVVVVVVVVVVGGGGVVVVVFVFVGGGVSSPSKESSSGTESSRK